MRTFLYLFLILTACSHSQKKDSLLTTFISTIPKGWSYTLSETSLTIFKNDSIYSVFHNKINECGNCPEYKKEEENRSKNYKTIGKKIRAEIIFIIGPYWNEPVKKKADKHNEIIYKKISALPKKYKIENLYDEFGSHKGTPTYRSATKEEQKRVTGYEAEKGKLEMQIKKYPNYQSTDHALFLIQKTGCDDELTDYYPCEASRECYSILNSASEIFKPFK
jgi:hypothetical protein